jgi:hypothetical protein
LIALHEVGIVVVFAVELGEGGDCAVEGQAGEEGLAHGFGVDDGEGAGHTEADGADVGVGRGVGDIGTAAAVHL